MITRSPRRRGRGAKAVIARPISFAVFRLITNSKRRLLDRDVAGALALQNPVRQHEGTRPIAFLLGAVAQNSTPDRA